MSKALFIERDKDNLIQVISTKLEALSYAVSNHPNIIAERQRSIEILNGYDPKDAKGQPIEPHFDAGDAEISISGGQATILKVTGSTISVKKLLNIVGGEITSNPSRAVKDRQSCAADLLQNGTKLNLKYDAQVAQYAYAAAAYAYLASWPKLVRESNMELIAHGEKLLSLLTQDYASFKLLLADKEYQALEAGAFLKFSGVQFFDEAQAERRYINSCVDHSLRKDGAYAFVALFDPEGVEAIEKMMSHDVTAKWLLDGIKKDKIPIILHQYSGVAGSTYGTYIVDYAPNGGEIVEYVRIFLNKLNYLDSATVAAHEIRHAWQKKIAALLKQKGASAVDKAVLEIFQEADCNAIHDKVGWNLNRITHQTGLEFNDHKRFQSRFAGYPQILTEETRIELAMRDRFFDYLNEEFVGLHYIKKSLGESREKGLPLPESRDMCRRALDNSLYLNSGFLRLVSQIGEMRSYLNIEDINCVIELVKDKLLNAIREAKVWLGMGPQL